ncbi:hypothetical protein DBV15_10989 [Temnothorax longispinosus]|uniref:DDE Tnp4 domain-containing protein n=1 Tax=Temnothorax longispinosus TaxID=300112 RepID=A0A4S2L363_9HYME|nr:hypothetical protein DBV15_10989 [Temnothorax longispinosus]
MHNARVFKNSPIYQRIINERNPLLLPEEHIIGDSAYPLMMNLMTPFRDTGHLSVAQSRYNTKLSSIRSDIDLGKQIIAAACVLHNFIQNNMDEYDINDAIEEIPNEEILSTDTENSGCPQMIAIQKREQIMRVLSHNN